MVKRKTFFLIETIIQFIFKKKIDLKISQYCKVYYYND
jgi:hypothetical protein